MTLVTVDSRFPLKRPGALGKDWLSLCSRAVGRPSKESLSNKVMLCPVTPALRRESCSMCQKGNQEIFGTLLLNDAHITRSVEGTSC